MGGPRAWKEAQQKRHEYQNSWDQDEQQTNNNEDDDEGKDTEKRDLYAEYDIDLETENEKSQRRNGMGDTGELPGQEDVSMIDRTWGHTN
jgi:Swi5-dependent recombination DNA repair protein 1